MERDRHTCVLLFQSHRLGETDRYLDALIVDSDVIQLKPDAPNFDL